MATDVSGCGFACSRAGFWKFMVLISGAACWGLYISSGKYQTPSIKIFVLIAFIISTVVSLFTYFMRVTALDVAIQSECMSFCTFDYFWSWASSMNYLACTVIMACFFGDNDPFCGGSGRFCAQAQQFTALLLGLLTAILYTAEAQNLKLFASVGLGYGTTWKGLWKAFILVIGAVAFGLLIQYRICRFGTNRSGCTVARTFTLAAFCIAWAVAALMYLLRIITCHDRLTTHRKSGFGAFEFFWSAFSCLLYLVGSALFAGFMQCSSNQFTTNKRNCRWKLAILVCGFVTAVLFGIDAFLLRNKRPIWLVRRRVRISRRGEAEVTTVTRETSTTR